MKAISTILFLVFGLVFFSITAHAVIQYTVTDLGSFGGDFCTAFGVNDSGMAVGYSRTNNPSVRVAYLWESGMLTDLGHLGDRISQANSINNQGQIAGYSESLIGQRAFLWLLEPAYGLPAGMNDLGTLGGPDSRAWDINNKGQVVGKAAAFPDMVSSHAFMWENGVMHDLGTLEGSVSEARAINNAGQVVGFADYKPGDPLNAFIWLLEPAYGLPAGMNRIGNDPSVGMIAFDINNNGYVVGIRLGESPYRQAFIWQIGTSNDFQMIMEERSTAVALNDNGWVVGSFEIEPGTSVNHAFLYRDGQVADLNSVIDPTSGWVLSSASSISNSGFIVGRGIKDGEDRAFILTPIPEPSAILIMLSLFSAISLKLRNSKYLS
jgi:probable HAF family extracellular repeat protein